MSIEIKIPVHPAVPKFLSHRYKVLPFFVSRVNPYGVFLYNSLIKHQHKNNRDDVPFNLVVYSAELRLLISEKTYQRQGWLIQPQKVIDFNKVVLDFIDQEFYVFMDIQTGNGNLIYHSIIAFRKKYDLLEEDLAVKTLEKKYERYRKELNSCKSDKKN